jgi:hypothetical protein
MTLGRATDEMLSQLYTPIKSEIAELFKDHSEALQLIWYWLNQENVHNIEIFYVRDIDETLGINRTLFDILPICLDENNFLRKWTEYIFKEIAKSHINDCDGLYAEIVLTEKRDIAITLHIYNWKISRKYQKVITI